MILDQWLKQATNNLKVANIGSARLDALILLEDEIGRDRAWILAHPEYEILAESLKKLNKRLARRKAHEPLAYIREKTEFYGRDFYVDSRVLEPRPESETMIDMLKRLRLPITTKIADVGAGSGALGITAALEIPRAVADFYDIDPDTLAVAEQNAKNYRLFSRYFHSDLLQQAPFSYDVVLANLPYVPARHQINRAASHEPAVAIFGGGDGLNSYHRLFEQIKKLPWQPTYVFTESLPPQHTNLSRLATDAGYKLKETHAAQRT